MAEANFKLGDQVIVSWRTGKALTVKRGTVTRVLKSGNFRVNDRTTQFKQSGVATGRDWRNGLLIELATPEALSRFNAGRLRMLAVRRLREAEQQILSGDPVGDVSALTEALDRFMNPEKPVGEVESAA